MLCPLPDSPTLHLILFRTCMALFNGFFLFNSLQWCCEKSVTWLYQSWRRTLSLYVFQERTVTHSCDSCDSGEVILTFCVFYKHPIGTQKRCKIERASCRRGYSEVNTTWGENRKTILHGNILSWHLVWEPPSRLSSV